MVHIHAIDNYRSKILQRTRDQQELASIFPDMTRSLIISGVPCSYPDSARKLYEIRSPFATLVRDIESLFAPNKPSRSDYVLRVGLAFFKGFHKIIARVIRYFKFAARNSAKAKHALLPGILAFAVWLGISGLRGRKLDGPTRVFHEMQEAYVQFGEKCIERAEMMSPNLKGMIETWRKTNKITSPTPMSPIELLKIRDLRISPHKINFVMEVRKKLNKTPSPPLPDPDCVPLRVHDGRILIGKYDSEGRFNILSIAITTPWQRVAKRVQAEEEFKRAIMYLNDNEFDEYLKLSGLW
jgi:hypothetical protein